MTKHMLLTGRSRDIHVKANALGVRLSLLLPEAKLADLKDRQIYDRIVRIADDAPISEWVRLAQEIHSAEPVDAIGAFTETAEEQAAAIAATIGLRYHHHDVIRKTHRKDEMRQTLRDIGLDDTASRLVEIPCAEAVEEFARAHGYPVVLKPVNARGSLGVSIVRGPSEVAAALDWFRRWAGNYQLLLEAFLEGSEWSIEAFSEDGIHRIVCITRKFKDTVHFVEVGHCVPAVLDRDTAAAIHALVQRTLSALRIMHGPSHTEVIVTAKGPRIVETHTRLAGDRIAELIELASGVDLEELWIRQTLGERVLDRVPTLHRNRYASIHYVSPDAGGTVESIEGVEKARALPGVARIEIHQPVGSKLEGTFDSFSRGASAIAVGDSAEEAICRARAAAAAIRFVMARAA